MKRIRPITDLRKTNAISDDAHQLQEPIFITKNGYSDLVVMAHELYEAMCEKGKLTDKKTSEEWPLAKEDEDKNMGFVKVACATIDVEVANPIVNSERIIEKVKECVLNEVQLLVFSELCLSGYTCQDLFLQDSLLKGVEKGIQHILKETKDIPIVFMVGAPVVVDDKCYNCAIVICKGKILGIVPKTFLPNYNEFYELRHFYPAPKENQYISYLDQYVPFGARLLFRNSSYKKWVMGIEICEDLWVPNPPSTSHALAGATILCNLSASNEIVGKKEYR